MVEFNKKFKKAWKQMVDDSANKIFVPHCEAEVQFYLGHLLLNNGVEPNEIRFEWKSDEDKRKRCDLVLEKLFGKKGKAIMHIEIKFFERKNKFAEHKCNERDYAKLINWKEVSKQKKEYVRDPVFILFIRGGSLNNETLIENLKNIKERLPKGIKFFSYPEC